jgi:hypothetical protein
MQYGKEVPRLVRSKQNHSEFVRLMMSEGSGFPSVPSRGAAAHHGHRFAGRKYKKCETLILTTWPIERFLVLVVILTTALRLRVLRFFYPPVESSSIDKISSTSPWKYGCSTITKIGLPNSSSGIFLLYKALYL